MESDHCVGLGVDSSVASVGGVVASGDRPAVVVPRAELVPDHTGVLRSFPVLVMVAACSRFITAVMIASRITGDLLAGMWPATCRTDRCRSADIAVGQRVRYRSTPQTGYRCIRILWHAGHPNDPGPPVRPGYQGSGGGGQRLFREFASARPNFHLASGLQHPDPAMADRTTLASTAPPRGDRSRTC